MKCWMKQGLNQSNMQIVLSEAENIAWNAKQMTQCCCTGIYLWGTTYLHIWIHIYILNFCTPLSCNSSLKSHRSSHHRCKNLYLYKLYLQKVPKWSQIFIFLFIAYRFASHFCCFCTVSFCKKSDSLCNVWSAKW